MGMAKRSKKAASKDPQDESFSEEESDDYYHSKRPRNAFIDVEAEVDEEEDEEEEDDEEYQLFKDEFIANEEEEEHEAKQLETATYRKLTSQANRKKNEQEELDVEAEERRLRELYGTQRIYDQTRAKDEASLPDQFLLPTSADPKLWLVKCRPGKEKSVVQTLMKKFIDLQEKGTPLLIQSALCRENLKGYVYIEAYKQAHVVHALAAVHNVYSTKISLVPLAEMVHVLRYDTQSVQTAAQIQPGQWVRVKRGKYTGDLAKVIDVLDVGEAVRVKLVPRLTAYMVPGNEKAPQKLFNPKEVSQLDNEHSVTKARGYWMYMGETYVDGFLEKDLKCATLITQGVVPSIDELSLFKVKEPTGGETEESAEPVRPTVSFAPGDSVSVVEGEFIGLKGRVASVTQDSLIVVQPLSSMKITKNITLQPQQLRKSFTQGDHVQIIDGVHKGESGLLVKIDQKYATIFSDVTMSEYTVFVNDLCEATHSLSICNNTTSSPVSNRRLNFDLFDLVQLENGTIGVIYRIGTHGATVGILDLFGTTREVTLQAGKDGTGNGTPSGGVPKFTVKNELGKGSTIDAHSNLLNPGDQVEVLDGPFAKNQGSILHVYKNNLFIRLKNVIDRAGLVAIRNTNLVLLGAIAHATRAQRSTATTPTQRPTVQRSDFELLNKTVTICSGPYKGYLGIVKGVQGDLANIELHTSYKVVAVDRSKLLVNEEPSARGRGPGATDGGRRRLPSSAAGYRAEPVGEEGVATTGGKTPSWEGGKTPSWEGGKTPTWEGGKTPSWSGGKTPNINPSDSWSAATSSSQSWETNDSGGSSVSNDWSMAPKESTKSSSWDTPSSKSSSWDVPSSKVESSGWGQSSDTPSKSTQSSSSGWQNWSQPTTSIEKEEPITWGAKRAPEAKSIQPLSVNAFIDGSFVRIIGGRYAGQEAIITDSSNNSNIKCKLVSSSNQLDLPNNQLEPMKPQSKDFVLIATGPNQGSVGTLMSIERNECIVRMAGGDGEMKVVPFESLIKIQQQQQSL